MEFSSVFDGREKVEFKHRTAVRKERKVEHEIIGTQHTNERHNLEGKNIIDNVICFGCFTYTFWIELRLVWCKFFYGEF